MLIDKKYPAQHNAATQHCDTQHCHTYNTTSKFPNQYNMPASGVLKRQGWTEVERKEIYDYANTQPDLTWRGTKRWFEGKYPSKILSQSQISKILNPTKRPGAVSGPLVPDSSSTSR